MPWFWIWTLLILGSLVLSFFLLRTLWRKMVALGEELGRANEVLAQLAERTDELTQTLEKLEEARQAARGEPLDLAAAQKNMKSVRAKRKAKKAKRVRKHTAKRLTWRDLALDPRFDRWRKK